MTRDNDKPVDGAEDAARELRRIATLIRHHTERDRLTRGSHHPEWHTGMRTAANHCDARAETLERRAARTTGAES